MQQWKSSSALIKVSAEIAKADTAVMGNFANMQIQYFNPFDNINLDPGICFLTGEDAKSPSDQISVFPEWVLSRFALQDKEFKLMDQFTKVKYGELRLPACERVSRAFQKLEEEIQASFNEGYEAVKQIPSERLFLWMGKIVYGILYHDMLDEKKRLEKFNQTFGLSPKLKERYGLFHLMLQSIVSPITFWGRKPWSYAVVKLKYSKDVFNFKDNPVTLDFSLGLNGFGIVACLQDNGLVSQYHQEIIGKIADTELHPVQFEELCAKFLYANYLFKHHLKYKFEQGEGGLVIEPILAENQPNHSQFAPWDMSMYSQVLANYLQPWGYTTKNIGKMPDGPISFLENDYSNALTPPDKIDLPF